MASRVEHELLLGLMDRSGLDDHQRKALLGVYQTTVWRLRNRRIAKVGKYVGALRRHVEAARDPEVALVQDLVSVARHSPKLRQLLRALADFMQEDA